MSIKYFVHGFQNLVTWFPVIWNYRPYDFVYLFTIMKQSLTEIRDDQVRSCSGCDDLPKTVKNLNESLEILDKLISEEYPLDKTGEKERSQDVKKLCGIMSKDVCNWYT